MVRCCSACYCCPFMDLAKRSCLWSYHSVHRLFVVSLYCCVIHVQMVPGAHHTEAVNAVKWYIYIYQARQYSSSTAVIRSLSYRIHHIYARTSEVLFVDLHTRNRSFKHASSELCTAVCASPTSVPPVKKKEGTIRDRNKTCVSSLHYRIYLYIPACVPACCMLPKRRQCVKRMFHECFACVYILILLYS